MKIQEAAENYLETVLMVSEKKGHVRQTDVCTAMNYSRPTVSVALRDLAAEGYLDIDEDGFITLTEAGHSIADRIYERHCVLSKVLMALGTDDDTAYHDACKIEHDLSEETFENIRDYYNKHKKN
jgi:Mn-dependent DtxR family transcriptional regulator